jgi:WD40 repeat protein
MDKLVVSPDGRRIVAVDRSGKVFAWDAEDLVPLVESASRECLPAMLGRATKVWGDSCRVVTRGGVEISTDDGGGKVCAKWPNQGPGVVLLDQGQPECIYFAISDDGRHTAVMVNNCSFEPASLVYVFETEHLLCAPGWEDREDLYSEAIDSCGEDGNVQEMIFSPDHQRLAIRLWKGNGVTIWDFQKGEAKGYSEQEWYSHAITAFAFLGNEKMIVGTESGEIEVWDLRTSTQNAS